MLSRVALQLKIELQQGIPQGDILSLLLKVLYTYTVNLEGVFFPTGESWNPMLMIQPLESKEMKTSTGSIRSGRTMQI